MNHKIAAYMKMLGFFWLLFCGIDYANLNFVPQIQEFNKKYKKKQKPIIKEERIRDNGVVHYDRVNSGWGWRSDPFTYEYRFHRGIDFAGRYGSVIPAVKEGYVSRISKSYRGCGHQVVIKVGKDTFNKYCHMSKIYVKRGQRIAKGQLIGEVGSTGRSTGSHLHFELTNSSGIQRNPSDFFEDHVFNKNYHSHTGGN